MKLLRPRKDREEAGALDPKFQALNELADRILKVPKSDMAERERIWKEWKEQSKRQVKEEPRCQ
jgi:hypothetical protein